MMARLGDAWRGHAWHGAARRCSATAMAAILSAAIALPVEAHCYSRWYYPWPQRCGVARQMVRPVGREKAAIHLPTEEPDIPLPSLARADLDGGEADEATRAHALLRAALEAANGH